MVSLRLRGELEWVEGRLLEEWGGLLAAYHRYRVQPHGSGPLLKVFGLRRWKEGEPRRAGANLLSTEYSPVGLNTWSYPLVSASLF